MKKIKKMVKGLLAGLMLEERGMYLEAHYTDLSAAEHPWSSLRAS